MLNKLLYKYKYKQLFFFVIGLFFIEILTTFLLYFLDLKNIRIVGFYKLLFEIYLLVSLFFIKLPKKLLYGTLIIIITYVFNQLLNPNFFQNIENHILTGSLYYLNRYIYIFLFIVVFFSLANKEEFSRKIVKLIETLLFINAFFIIFGALTHIDFFTSYPQSPTRFGSDGFFNKVNEVSYFYIIYITSLYYSYITSKKINFKLFFICFASFFIGTKIILLYNVLLLLFHLLFVSKYRKKTKLVIIPIVFFSLFYSKLIFEYLFLSSPFWTKLLEKYSVITLMLSTRDLLVISNYYYIIENWQAINYFIGGPFYTEEFTRTRMTLLDLLLHFGMISTLVYLYLISKYFFYKNRFNLTILTILIISCSFLAGGLFLRIPSLIYLFLTLVYLNSLSVRVKNI